MSDFCIDYSSAITKKLLCEIFDDNRNVPFLVYDIYEILTYLNIPYSEFNYLISNYNPYKNLIYNDELIMEDTSTYSIISNIEMISKIPSTYLRYTSCILEYPFIIYKLNRINLYKLFNFFNIDFFEFVNNYFKSFNITPKIYDLSTYYEKDYIFLSTEHLKLFMQSEELLGMIEAFLVSINFSELDF